MPIENHYIIDDGAKLPKAQRAPILRFIRNSVREAGKSGVVVGVSGGIDSAVVAYLAARALGPDNVLGALLFEDESKGTQDYDDAKKLISELKIKSIQIPITPIFESFRSALQNSLDSRVALGNIKSRVRMILLYALANERNLLVAGTGDRSEEELGYFTKYGDGGVDFQPIAHLYKTQVRQLALDLGVPESIANKPSSPNLWKGQLATDEIPLDYPLLDKVLYLLYEKNVRPSAVSKKVKVPINIVRETMKSHDRNAHKRNPPPDLNVQS